MPKILILGASGLVGRALSHELTGGVEVFGTYHTTSTDLPPDRQFPVDIHCPEAVTALIRVIQPDIVISCVRGEFQQQLRFHAEVANEVRRYNRRMYYFSTTNVFDGDGSTPHAEQDMPQAQSAYGQFKITCETLLKNTLGDQAIIIRIPAVWGTSSPRWHAVKDRIQNQTAIEVYRNLVGNNVLDVVLAKQLRFVIERELTGIFHLASMEGMTQAHFYQRLLHQIGTGEHLLRYGWYADQTDPYYFQLRSCRDEIPPELRSTHDDIITYLVDSETTSTRSG